jgi:hypothetical protein
VCILVAVANGPGDAAEAAVEYADVWEEGAYLRRDKLTVLDAATDGTRAITYRPVPGAEMDHLKPAGFGPTGWPSIADLLRFRWNGIVTYRDHFAYSTTRAAMVERIRTFLTLEPISAAETFKETRDRKCAGALTVPFAEVAIEPISYRPLDIRFLYNRRAYIDFPKAAMQAAWGESNVALTALDDGTGAGPAVWCQGLKPDQHAFSGRGGWLFLLRQHGGEAGGHWFDPALMPALGRVYGEAPTAQATFDAMLALLSATSYTARFAADLEDAFPHVPFPAAREDFVEASRIGAEIRTVQTFARDPGAPFRRARLAGRASGVTLDAPKPSAFRGSGDGLGAVALQGDQSLRLERLSERAWLFAVSGYRVLHRWLDARHGDALDATLTRGICDVEELLHWFDAADPVLARAVAASLTRDDLGLGRVGQGPVE